MDVSPHLDARAPPAQQPPPPATTSGADAASPTLHQQHPSPTPGGPASNSQLAALLSESYRETDALRRELTAARKRAEKAERIAQALDPSASAAATTSSPPSGGANASNTTTNGPGPTSTSTPANPEGSSTTTSPSPEIQKLKQQHAEAIKHLVDEYEERLAAFEENETRRRMAQEGWEQLERYLGMLELRARDARGAYSRIVDAAPGAAGSPSPTLASALVPVAHPSGLLASSHGHSSSHSLGGHSYNMAPPHTSSSSRHTRHHSHSTRGSGSSVVFPLPPHPNPHGSSTHNSTTNALATGSRRQRTPSMDSYGGGGVLQPPSKRLRGDDERERSTRGREGRAYTESYIPHHPDYRAGPLLRPSDPATQSQPRIIDRKYGSSPAHNYPTHPHAQGQQHHSGHHRRRSSRSHSRSGSHSSASSLDVDEMLLRATAGDEGSPVQGHPHPGMVQAPNGRYYDHMQPQQPQPQQQQQGQAQTVGQPSRRRSEREEVQGHPNHIVQPYPQHAYPANQSAPPGHLASAPGVAIAPAPPAPPGVLPPGTAAAQAAAARTGSHVYTTHVFAPVVTGAPTKKSKFPNTAMASAANVDPSNPGAAGNGTTASVPFAATNAQGQRICRQCGMVGRYKDGKCVEKWGPGPMGPGTVCDRCRKKMKRVERRGTLESQQQLQNLAIQQQQQYQPRTTSHAQLPLSQGSDRSIQRTDTMLTNQASHGPGSFAQTPHSHGQSHSTLRTSSTHPSVAGSPSKNHGRQAPTPPAIASLREQNEEEEEGEGEAEDDPDQLPTSNVGRGGGRATTRNGRTRAAGRSTPLETANGSSTKRSPRGAGGTGRASIPPRMEMDVDEMDADADADAEADAEAEILGAVAAALNDDGEGDGEGDMEADGDADAELLEAVDAAEANSSSSHGG
ncbi:unnamed protein product [Cyclocybe aegerita]|uniref:Uncharacterized protein n=1 Tax=Cyclocybe aegerita TaxID=1973307 RepID=A0A8S0X6F4_CYCAE|nr:unnamed protein product [Cyclocybe aegerita]